MCGIFGLVSEKWQDSARSAAQLIAHRGPDDQGVYRDHPLYLAHYRLSILDLSLNGHQPMISDDGRFIIILNGEIYNHLDIRKNYPDRNYNSNSDTETILHAFAQEGTSLFAKLNGIFALAIYDKKERELILSRDHLGVKPLYYHESTNGFAFSSEFKSIAALPGVDKSLNIQALLDYVQFMYSPGCNTPFHSIRKFEPGHFMRISIPGNKILEYKSFYRIPFTGTYSDLSEQEWIEKIDQQLKLTIQRQLLSDVPVGYFISGGLDSSLIAAISKSLHPDKRLTGFTIRNADQGNRDGFADDFPYAVKVAKFLDIDLQVVDGKVDLQNDLESMVWQLDEPQTEISSFYVDSIARLARSKGFYVLLSGMGGDDLFAGYRRHIATRYDAIFYKTPYKLRQAFAQWAARMPVKLAIFRRLRKYLVKFKEENIQSGIVNYYKWLQDDRAKAVFAESHKKVLEEYNGSDLLLNSLTEIPNEHHPLNQLLYWDMRYFLPDHNLNYTDKMSMKHGVEVRVPFCDPDLVNLSTLIQPQLKIKNGISKYLLKKVAERYLPDEIIYRPKTGFGGPLRQWITDDFKAVVENYLRKDKLQQYSVFDSDEVHQLIEDNQSGKVDASYPIFGLLAIQAWMRNYLK